MSKFLHADNNEDKAANNEDDKAIAIPQIFSKNGQAKNACYWDFLIFPQHYFASVTETWDCVVQGKLFTEQKHVRIVDHIY